MISYRSLLCFALTLPLGFVAPAFAQDDPAPQQDGEGMDNPNPPGQDGGPRRGPGGQGGQGRGGRGMGRMGLPLDQMKEQLGLSPEQVTQLEAVQADLRKQFEGVREKMQNGEFDPGQMREMFQKGRTEMEEKLKGILTPEQFQKYEATRQEMMGRGRRGGRGGEGGEGRGGRGRGGEQLGARLREEAVKSLALSEEESAVVLPRLDTVLETRKLVLEEQNRRRDEFLKKVKETTDGSELAKLLADFRAAKGNDGESLKAAQSQLTEVLTVEQEAKLVALNILD